MPRSQEEKEKLVQRAHAAKDDCLFHRADNIFEYSQAQMRELNLALSALSLAFLEQPY